MKKRFKENNVNKGINNSLKYKTPDIILDNYQDVKYINKVQPLGWNKQGIWVGINKNKKTRKKIINTIPSTLKFMYNDNTCTIYTKELDNRYATSKDINKYASLAQVNRV